MRKLLVISAVSLAACGQIDANNVSASTDAHPAALVGRWSSATNPSDCAGPVPSTQFLADGQARLGGNSGSWHVEGDRLVLDATQQNVETIIKIPFHQEGDRILLQDSGHHALVRCGSRAAQEASAQVQANSMNTIVDGPMAPDAGGATNGSTVTNAR